MFVNKCDKLFFTVSEINLSVKFLMHRYAHFSSDSRVVIVDTRSSSTLPYLNFFSIRFLKAHNWSRVFRFRFF